MAREKQRERESLIELAPQARTPSAGAPEIPARQAPLADGQLRDRFSPRK